MKKFFYLLAAALVLIGCGENDRRAKAEIKTLNPNLRFATNANCVMDNWYICTDGTNVYCLAITKLGTMTLFQKLEFEK